MILNLRVKIEEELAKQFFDVCDKNNEKGYELVKKFIKSYVEENS